MLPKELGEKYIADLAFIREEQDPNYDIIEDNDIHQLMFTIKSDQLLENLRITELVRSKVFGFNNYPSDNSLNTSYLRLLFSELFKYPECTSDCVRLIADTAEKMKFTKQETEKILIDALFYLERANENPRKWLTSFFNYYNPTNQRLRNYFGISDTPVNYYLQAKNWSSILGDITYTNFETILVTSSFLLDYRYPALDLSQHENYLFLLVNEIYNLNSPESWCDIYNFRGIYDGNYDVNYSYILDRYCKLNDILMVDFTINSDNQGRKYITSYDEKDSYCLYLTPELVYFSSEQLKNLSNKIFLNFSYQNGQKWGILYPMTDLIYESKKILKWRILEHLKIYRDILDELVLGHKYELHDEMIKLLWYMLKNGTNDYHYPIATNAVEWINFFKKMGDWDEYGVPTEEFLQNLNKLKVELQNYVYNSQASYTFFHNIPF